MRGLWVVFLLCSHAVLCAQLSLPKVAIVFDDLLRNPQQYETALNIPVSLNFAVIPGFQYSRANAQAVYDHGQEVLIHFPMQAQKGRLPHYTFKLVRGMGRNEIQYHLNEAFRTVPYARGLNNHMGSQACQDAGLMATFMDCFKTLNQKSAADHYFLDSKTAAHSQAGLAAEAAGIKTFYRNVFLDGLTDEAYLQKQLDQLVRSSQTNGYAVGICHVRPETMRFMAHKLPGLRGKVEFVHLSLLKPKAR